jgi:AcrR family transcriptional regulator
MRPGDARTGRGRPPGRGPKVRTAVLGAALGELTDTGYAALTVENVARRAGVHKTTVYRRWNDRDSLVADAVSELAATRVPFPDSGDIRADLRTLARSLVRFLASPAGQAVTAIRLSDAGRIPQVASAQRHFFEDRYRQAEPVIRAAIARAELPAGVDPAEVVRAVTAPIFLRVLVTAEPISERIADAAADAALAAARAGALSPPADAADCP